jgi:hypothetical protein
MNVNIGNWRTTLAGILAGTIPIIQGYLTGTLTWDKCVLGVLIAVLGYFAKDATTGSTP